MSENVIYNDYIREIDGRFWVYEWDEQHNQCRRGEFFAGGSSDSAVKYVGKPYSTKSAAKRAILNQYHNS